MWRASPVSLRTNEKVGTTFRWTMVKEKCSDFLKEAKPSGGVKSLWVTTSGAHFHSLSRCCTHSCRSKVAVNASLFQNVLNIVELWRGRSFFRRSSAHSRFPFRCLLAAALENIWFSDYKRKEACVYKMIRGEANLVYATIRSNRNKQHRHKHIHHSGDWECSVSGGPIRRELSDTPNLDTKYSY